ncbi:DUF6686 family protein [Bacteroides helcogenes]|uniref:Uncharacterized protein n=1 Tax=Bacteroides helcogenes (strain ATCC 35417 / DSM 20613 / JCM 6297 / CCUG 15421 / P 36-108) TaxID=693979 RepID=E6SP49_BACT6|nr:DUF6686 family protein [Bacteroides helcogenes]ADV43819.1 hypothetical protein Bache_1841 [Bacteroides helcogenes P 36-108]MDY5237450.1 DUF6686 family protein [Bacteroides helcogenes]
MDSILKQTSNGFISFCSKCNAYNLEFGNLFFRFTEDEFQHFCRYISSIDGEYYQRMNQNMRNARKIFLRMPLQGFYCALHREELEELKRLVDYTNIEEEVNSFQNLEHYSLN